MAVESGVVIVLWTFARWTAPVFGLAYGTVAVTYRDTINLGAILISIVVGVAALAVLAYGAKWKAAFESEKAVADSRSDMIRELKYEIARAHDGRTELTELLHKKDEQIAAYEARPTYEKVVELFGHLTVKQDAAASVRFERILDAIRTEHQATREILSRMERRETRE